MGCINKENTKEEAIEQYPEPVEDELTLSSDHEITEIVVFNRFAY
ncbi:HicB family protein [Candidatus Latescibacterota bacterium]